MRRGLKLATALAGVALALSGCSSDDPTTQLEALQWQADWDVVDDKETFCYAVGNGMLEDSLREKPRLDDLFVDHYMAFFTEKCAVEVWMAPERQTIPSEFIDRWEQEWADTSRLNKLLACRLAYHGELSVHLQESSDVPAPVADDHEAFINETCPEYQWAGEAR